MKKIILILSASALIFTGCKKEKLEEKCTSNCGVIINDGIDNGCYWLEIQNDCSGNNKTFCFDGHTWSSSYVGDSFCVTNEPTW